MGSYYGNILEEVLKNKVGAEWFPGYDTTQILGKVDFAVAVREGSKNLFDTQYLLWAESKQGNKEDVIESLIQLILTIGREKTNLNYVPPKFLGAFDADKIAFLPYRKIMDVFNRNDIDWTATPSDHTTPTFRLLLQQMKGLMEKDIVLFYYETDGTDLRKFISLAAKSGDSNQIEVTVSNLQHVYARWLEDVKPTIAIDWKAVKGSLLALDFFIADLLSEDNKTQDKAIRVLLKKDHYIFDKTKNRAGYISSSEAWFNDGQKAHTQFWNRYKRPPLERYWQEIKDRRDLLVPPDYREHTGAFFTPPVWSAKSKEYIAKVLGDDWQDKYYVWDCCGGTGNLEEGLANKYNVYVSTLDKGDVDIIHSKIQGMNTQGSSNILDAHVFQFDFLNDPFLLDKPEESKLPRKLINILNDPAGRERLVVYINPPGAEGDSREGRGRSGVAESRIHDLYGESMGYSKRELYIQFLTRIYKEIPGCVIAEFSKLKNLQAPKFTAFRTFFKARLESVFIMPANSFDNVTAAFPYSFQIWDTAKTASFDTVTADVYDDKGRMTGTKVLVNYDKYSLINDWAKTFWDETGRSIATIIGVGNDFQNQRSVRIEKPHRPWNHQFQWQMTAKNLIPSCVYFAARLCVAPTWLNDRDQYLAPYSGWQGDAEFCSDCLTFAIFNMKNNVSIVDGQNDWIPFTENEVGASDKFASHFMTDFINGRAIASGNKANVVQAEMFGATPQVAARPMTFSSAASAVFGAGRKLWRYYHEQPGSNPDASLYDIRLFFQGVNDQGKMNATSGNEAYNGLIGDLRLCLKALAKCIEPKVYEYGFLRK